MIANQFTFFNTLILSLCLIAILTAIIALLFSKRRHKSFKYLAFFMITVALENLQIWFVYSQLSKEYPEILLFFWPFEMLATPLFFLFIISYIGKKTSYKVYKACMFIPLLFFAVTYLWIKIDLIWLEGEALNFARTKLRLFKVEEYVALVFVIFNGFYCYKVIRDFEREKSMFSYKKVVAHTVWLKRILHAAFFLCFLWAITFAFVKFGKYNFGTDPYIPSYLGFSILVIWLGYIGYMQTRVLHERQLLHQFIKNDTPIVKKEKVNDSSILGSESKSNDHYKNLVYWFEKDEVYYNSQLDLRMVSEYLGISPNYVSKIINTHHETNFSEFINSYRIKEAKKMLKSKEFERYTILSIALEAGFNSRTAFYTSFKKHTGTSPSNFRREPATI